MASPPRADAAPPLPPALLSKLHPLTPWHEQVEALQQLADLTIPLSKTANVDAIMRQLRPHTHHLAHIITNPRSTLVKEACLCVETLAETFGPKFVHAVGTEVIPALLRRCAITKAVIRDSSREAAKAMFEHGVEGVNLGTARFISHTVLDKHAPVLIRAAAAEFIGMILVDRCRGSLSEIHQLVSDAIIGGCADSDETVRAISRENCCRLLQLEPALGGDVFDQLPANAQQYIARLCSVPKAMEEPLRPRRASMMPQRARPKPELFGANVPPNLKARYAPSRVHRASVNPVELGAHTIFSDSMPPRASILPRPSRVEFEASANLPRKHSRPNLRLPRRSMAPKLPSIDMESIGAKDDIESKTSPSARVIAPSHSLIKASISTEFTSVAQRTRSATRGKRTQHQAVENTFSHSPVSTNASAGTEHGIHASLSTMTESSGGPSHHNKLGTPPVSKAMTASSNRKSALCEQSAKCQSPANDARVVNTISSASPRSSLPHSPTETKPVSTRLRSPTASSSEASKSSAASPTATTESAESAEEPVKRVNKGRLSFIMGVNQTPHAIRARSMLRPDMSASAFMMSPASVKGEQVGTDVCDQMDIDMADAVDETRASEEERTADDNDHISNCGREQTRKSGGSGEAEHTARDAGCAATLEDKACDATEATITDGCEKSRDIEETVAAASGGEQRSVPDACASATSLSVEEQTDKAHELKECDKRSDSSEQLLKTPQLCMADISDFAELMADIEKQALCSVTPKLSLCYDATKNGDSCASTKVERSRSEQQNSGDDDGGDKENRDGGTRQKRVQLAVQSSGGVRKDSADMKAPPTYKSRAASFKGRPPRRSLMPQNGGATAMKAVTTSATGTTADGGGDKKRTSKRTAAKSETTKKSGMERKGSMRGATSSGATRAPATASEKRKKTALPASVEQVAEALRLVKSSMKHGWEQKTRALTTLHERTRALNDHKLPARLAEDCASTSCELVFDGHNKVALAALEALFFLLLCCEGAAQTRALQRALHRRGDALRRVLALSREHREDRRLASERVLDAFCVQFTPETQVTLLLHAMTLHAGAARGVDARVATAGCGVLERAFERALRSEGGFVWNGATLELLLSTAARLLNDRRLHVRRGARAAAAGARRSLPPRAFDMACRRVGVAPALFSAARV